MASGYREQYERANRYLRRLIDLQNGIVHVTDSESYADDLHAFYQNCYHLKDWIKNDPSCRAWSDVEAYVTSDRWLSMCADLCNAQKHLVLNRHRSTESPAPAGGNISLLINDGLGGQEKVQISISYKISTSSGALDALEVANRSMQAWAAFLRANGAVP